MGMGKSLKTVLFFALVSFFLCTDRQDAGDRLLPYRTAHAPVIDGQLDDSVWRNAQALTGFRTFIPDFGKDISEKTTVYMAYDAENLYFAFDCHDRDPQRIKATLANRDTIFSDDFVCINLDSFNDRQALYAFYVNPMGVQGDSRFASNQEDFSVDLVWTSAGALTGSGYAVEMKIPFKSIRYAGKERVEMAIFFERYISRTTEHGSVPELDPARGYAFLSQMQPLELRDIRRYTLIEVLPDFVFSQRHERDEQGLLQRSQSRGEFGLTGKLGITSQLILDAAVNPDFSQVESDAGQVDANLRYALYYDEKRPFFLEGSEIFKLAGSSPFQAAVHTRQIVDPILGLKLSGKLGKKDSLATIFALDEMNEKSDPSDRAGFFLFRYKRALTDDGYLGFFYTGREQGDNYNRLSGIDGQVRFSKAAMLNLNGFVSFTGNQLSEEVTGHTVAVNYDYSTRNLGYGAGVYTVSPDFCSDSGYLTRNGVMGFDGHLAPILYPQATWLRKVTPQLTLSIIRDHDSKMLEMNSGVVVNFLLKGNTTLRLDLLYGSEIFLGQRFDVSLYRAVFQSWLNKKFYVYIGLRRGNLIRYIQDPYQGFGSTVSLQFRFLPMEYIVWETRFDYADMFDKSDGQKVYDYTILRNKLTFQLNKNLFLRGIIEYNSYRKELITDLLASFTYIPGTVLQLGYGSLYERTGWEEANDRSNDRFLEMRRGLFFKVSYLWRL